MLKNYFKIAIAVLKRRKFFTFISLFGISFTLTILIVLTAFIDHLVSPSYPDINRNRELFINVVELKSSKGGGTLRSPLSLSFFHDHVAKIKIPVKLALYAGNMTTNAYQNGKKIVIEFKYTNSEYWDVYQFDFIEGKAFSRQQMVNADKVAIISEETRAKYFGEGVPALGKYFEASNVNYRVVGVVKSVSYLNFNCFADVYFPNSLFPDNIEQTQLRGEYDATVLLNDKKDLPVFQEELKRLMKRIPYKDKELDLVYVFADSYMASFTRQIFGEAERNGETEAMSIIAGLIIFFMLLPTINLVNINVSRIMERSSEIGVRKAFGASSKTLTYQFIVENLILTLFGGALGLTFSAIVIEILNRMQLAPNMYLSINLTVLFYSLVACLVFGLFSGVYPAWRMSKLNVVNALKTNN